MPQSSRMDGDEVEDRPRSDDGPQAMDQDLREIARKLRKLRSSSRRSGEHGQPAGTPRRPSAAEPAAPASRAKAPPEPLHVADLRRRARPGPAQTPNPGPAPQPAREEPVRLEQVTRGIETTDRDGCPVWVLEGRLSARDRRHSSLNDRLAGLLVDGAHALTTRLRGLAGAEGLRPEDIVFLDLETTGLQSTPLFLVGSMVWEDGSLVVRQYFARHYGEERGAISLFADQLASRRLLVTFNGKSFDWPYLRMRATALRLPVARGPAHLDLLHEARRVWAGRLPDCKLQTLEQHVCGRPPRVGDIPGAEIPEAYHDFVRTQDATQVVSIIEHNDADLVTLAELLVRLPG